MNVLRRQPKSETVLLALYKRRATVLLLIGALENYQRAKICSIQTGSRQAPPTAA